jgi:integrase
MQQEVSIPCRQQILASSTFSGLAKSKSESATRDWQGALKGVFKEARMPDGHAHRFRDTFAVGLLQAGVPMDRVSALLGHSSIKVTEKHYSPWVRARQEQLEADVRRTWGTERGRNSEGVSPQ